MTQSPATTEATRGDAEDNNGGRVVLLLVLGLLLLAGILYAAAYAGAGDKVPRGTTIADVAVGGQSPDDAVATLRQDLAGREQAPFEVSAGSAELRLTPDEAGLAVDHEASVAAAGGGRSWSPARLWDYYTGGDDLDAVVTVDEPRMTRALDRLATESGTAPQDGAIRFVRGDVKVTDAQDGEGIDPGAAREALTAAYLSDDTAVDLVLVPQQPEVDQSDVQRAMDEFANPAVSGAVTLVFDDTRVRLTPEEYSRVLGMKAQGGVLVPTLDEKKLARLVESRIADEGAPVDATVRLVDGRPQVVKARPGVRYDQDDISSAFLGVVVKDPGERELAVEATVARPEFTTKDARALKITERVSTFTTYFPYAEYRNVNIGRAGELVNGTVLKPGETFSLNDTVGERTRENGFTEGFIISNGIFKEDLGGGVSQMATTTFNAMFFAGLEDVEHKPHSFYIDRYPVGREATVAWGAVDLRFTNDTPYGVLIEASVTPSTPTTSGVVTVSMWSTKYWDITTSASDRYNLTQPKTRTLTTEDCYPNEGYGGFDIDVYRYFRKHGSSELVRTEKFHTTYIPSDTVVCKEPSSSDR